MRVELSGVVVLRKTVLTYYWDHYQLSKTENSKLKMKC